MAGATAAALDGGAASEADQQWHPVAPGRVLASLGSTPDGLDAAEAEQRRSVHGRNELVDGGSISPLRIIWEQLSAVMVIIRRALTDHSTVPVER